MNISISNEAKLKIEHNLKNQTSDKIFRIEISGFSWSGPEFSLVLDEQACDDSLINISNINFVLAPEITDLSSQFIIDVDNNKNYIVTTDKNLGIC